MHLEPALPSWGCETRSYTLSGYMGVERSPCAFGLCQSAASPWRPRPQEFSYQSACSYLHPATTKTTTTTPTTITDRTSSARPHPLWSDEGREGRQRTQRSRLLVLAAAQFYQVRV